MEHLTVLIDMLKVMKYSERIVLRKKDSKRKG